MKLFITGISGLLGLNMAQQFKDGYQVSGCYHTHPVALDKVQAIKLDMTSCGEIDEVLGKINPDVIVNTIALTSVDACEAVPELAYRINVETAVQLAKSANTLGAKLVHISTDHLYDGIGTLKSEGDSPTLLNVYAKTKLEADEAVLQARPEALVIRTNFYGWGTSIRSSFSDWILRSLEDGRELTMFSDLYFTPILANDLADVMLGLVDRGACGIFHVAGDERLSKYDFAIRVARAFGYPEDKIRAISVDHLKLQAQRPKDMSLSSEKAQRCRGIPMPTLEDGLARLKALETRGHREALENAVQKGLQLSGVPTVRE